MAKRGRPRKSSWLVTKRRLFALNEFDKRQSGWRKALGRPCASPVRRSAEKVSTFEDLPNRNQRNARGVAWAK